MPNYILTQSSVILCPHGGLVTHIPISPSEFRIEGMLPMLLTDHYLVSGCPNMGGPGVRPCLDVFWVNPSLMLLVHGIPALTNASVPLVRDVAGVPTGAAIVTSFQFSYPEPSELTQVD
ncbi:MAG: hypothetical protein OEM82_04235 [Acidobacteriota bacterium]|nr:hypothetical protein [Acidobacteriota bacterium]MDH3528359.1 hypothetical protein [Acidobacteriota bacterium]